MGTRCGPHFGVHFWPPQLANLGGFLGCCSVAHLGTARPLIIDPAADPAQVQGPTNRQVLRLLLPTEGPQWALGGTPVYDHFRFDHCSEPGRRKPYNSLHQVCEDSPKTSL